MLGWSTFALITIAVLVMLASEVYSLLGGT
jgi:hypothetical protein